MVRIGIAGIGFMGVTHFKAIQRIRNAKCVALFTRDAAELRGDWSKVQGNFGPPGGNFNLKRMGVRAYDNVDALIEDPNIDLLDICLPTNHHPRATLQALQAGKHVLVEKPLAITMRDADKMVATAKKCNRQLAVAQVLRYFPEFRLVKDLADSGKHGSIRGAHFKRIISRPHWGAGWFERVKQTGGPALDLHIHDTDFVQFLFGMPKAVQSTGLVAENGQVEYITTQYLFDNKELNVTCNSGAVAMKSLMFEHGYDVYFEKATLMFDSATMQRPKLYPEGDRKPIEPKVPGKDVFDAFVGEIKYAVDCIETGVAPTIISGETARDSLRICLKEIESVKKGGKPVKL